MAIFSLRIPSAWAGRIDSRQTQAWLAEFFQSPNGLPADPGPGEEQISLSLPDLPVEQLAARLRESNAGAIRRLAAAHLPTLEPKSAIASLGRQGSSATARGDSLNPSYEALWSTLGDFIDWKKRTTVEKFLIVVFGFLLALLALLLFFRKRPLADAPAELPEAPRWKEWTLE